MNTALTKTTPIKTTPPSALQLMASRLSVDPNKLYETLKSTVFQKATTEELMALVIVSNEYGLNPFTKQIYGFPAKGGGIVPVVSVDGWNSMLIRQPDFDGIEFEFLEGEDGIPYSCTATIYIKNRSHPVRITEYFAECKRNSEPWNTMPHRMLRNRTLCQASRVAFGFSGVKHEEEVTEIEATVISPLPPTPPPKEVKPADGKTPQAELESLCVTGGFTFDHLAKWAESTGNIDGVDSMPSFAEIPTDVCRRLLRAPAGLLKGLEQAKEAK